MRLAEGPLSIGLFTGLPCEVPRSAFIFENSPSLLLAHIPFILSFSRERDHADGISALLDQQVAEKQRLKRVSARLQLGAFNRLSGS